MKTEEGSEQSGGGRFGWPVTELALPASLVVTSVLPMQRA